MRQTCLNEVFDLAKADERIFFIGSDLGVGTLDKFKEELPNRFFMEGISEANIIGMATGLALDGKVYRPVEGDPLSYLAALGASGVGSLYIVVHALELGEGDVAAPYHEYGNTFTLVAGLLNLLVILDAFDFAVLRARAAPPWAAKPDSP